MAVCSCGRYYDRNKKYTCCSECLSIQVKQKQLEKGFVYSPGKGGNNKKGIEGYTYSNGTGLYRKLKLASMKEWLCEECATDLSAYIKAGGRNSKWTVHHLNGNKQNNDVSNLKLLCKRCHQLLHNCINNLPS